jgi:hypothetical protein
MRRWVEDRFADGLSCHLKTCFWVAGQEERAGGLGTRSIQTILVALLMLLVSSTPALAQTPQPMPPGPPQNPLRPVLAPVGQADENWSFLRNPANRTDLWDPLKYIPLDSSGNYYLTSGSKTVPSMNGFRTKTGAKVCKPSAAIGFNV